MVAKGLDLRRMDEEISTKIVRRDMTWYVLIALS